MKNNKIKLMLDLATFAAFLVLMDPRTSGIPVHEWLAVAMAATIMVHLLLNWQWIVEVTSRVVTGAGNGKRFSYLLNWLLFVDGILIMLSGFMISESVVPLLGLSLPQNFTWRGLHELSTNIAMLLLGVHVALHWKWIVDTAKRLLTPRSGVPLPQANMPGKDVKA